MAQKKFSRQKKSIITRKKSGASKTRVSKYIFNKKKRNVVSGRKRKTPGSGRGKSLFCRKNLELAATICLLSLAVVLFARILRWEPVAGQSPGAVQRQLSDTEEYQILPAEEGPCGRPEILHDYIVKNPYSRSGVALEQVNGIVVHYVANAGSTARENRDYFENLKDTHLTKASSHFIIGLDGEIIQCIPLDEISYASNERNGDTISIECCHPKKDGKFNKKTYRSLVRLVSWLCASYGLSDSAVIRHYDVTGKMCPKYFVKHEDAWEDFLSDIERKLEKNR